MRRRALREISASARGGRERPGLVWGGLGIRGVVLLRRVQRAYRRRMLLPIQALCPLPRWLAPKQQCTVDHQHHRSGPPKACQKFLETRPCASSGGRTTVCARGGSLEPFSKTPFPFRAHVTGTPDGPSGEVQGGGGGLRSPNIYDSE